MSKRSRGRTCPVCQLPERLHEPDGTCPGSIFEPIPTKGLPPRAAGPAEVPSPAPAGPPVCRCGHDLNAHLPDPPLVCRVCGFSTQGYPTGNCMGWWPPDVRTAQVELVEAGPPDLHQAIQAATEALMTWEPESDENRPMQAAKVMVTAAAPHLHADLQQMVSDLRTELGVTTGLACDRGGIIADLKRRLEQAEAELRELRPQVENWHVYLRWRGKQDERERELDDDDLAAPATPEVSDG